jgi:hypothetical protein
MSSNTATINDPLLGKLTYDEYALQFEDPDIEPRPALSQTPSSKPNPVYNQLSLELLESWRKDEKELIDDDNDLKRRLNCK